MTLEPGVEDLIRREMHERRASFKQVVNDALRRGLQASVPATPFETPTFDLGVPRVDLDRALALAGALEDEERQRRMVLGR